MPTKKTQRRPNRARSRTARPAAAPVRETAADETVTRPSAGSAAVPVAPPPTASRAPSTPLRRATATRRAPTTVINYNYLRHDLKTLAVLAPVMVILVVLAFLFIH